MVESRWETRDELLDAAGAEGYDVSASQLRRLYRAGLLPAPEIRPLGRGRGTESRYPPGSTVRLLRVLGVRAREHRLSYTAWRLWWEDGGIIPPPAREVLFRAASSLEKQRQRLDAFVTGAPTADPAENAATDYVLSELVHGRLRGPLAEVRGNVGREQFADVVQTLVSVGTGRFHESSGGSIALEDEALVEQALGLGRGRTDHFANSEPWLGEAGLDLARLSQIVASQSFGDLANTDSLQLDFARAEIQSLLATVMPIAALIIQLHGKGAFGLGLFGRFFEGSDPHSQAMILLGWLLLRKDPLLRDGLARVGGLAPQTAATTRAYELIVELRTEIPRLAPILSDERLAASQLDEKAAASLRADIKALRDKDPEPFDAFFAKHPESEQLITTLDQAASQEPRSPRPVPTTEDAKP